MAWRMRPGFFEQANRGTGVSPCLVMHNSVEAQRQQLLAMLNPCDVAGMQNLGMTATSRLAKRPFLYGMFETDDEFGDCESVRRGVRVEKKRRLTPEQVRSLETSFESENKLEPDRKLKLAQQLGLQPRQVAVWFQNRRARWKTKELERLYESLKLRLDAELAEKERWKAEATKLGALLREREGEEEIRKKMIVCEDNIMSQKPECSAKFAGEQTAANDTTPHPLLQLQDDVDDHNNEDDDDGSGAGDYSWLLKASHACTNTNNSDNCSCSSCGCRSKVEVEYNNANSNTNQFQAQAADQYQQQQHIPNSALDPEQMYYSYMFRSGLDETFNSLLWCWPDFSRTIISSTSGGAPATTATPATTVVTNNSSSSSNPLADVL